VICRGWGRGRGVGRARFSRSVSEGMAMAESPKEELLAYIQDQSFGDDSFVEDYGTPIDAHDRLSAIDLSWMVGVGVGAILIPVLICIRLYRE